MNIDRLPPDAAAAVTPATPTTARATTATLSRNTAVRAVIVGHLPSAGGSRLQSRDSSGFLAASNKDSASEPAGGTHWADGTGRGGLARPAHRGRPGARRHPGPAARRRGGAGETAARRVHAN